MSSICSGRAAAYRGGGSQVDVPEPGGTVCTGSPASRQWVAQDDAR
jgi:hypothetical protein